MNIAYVRVSSIEPDEEKQKEILQKDDIERWFEVKVSDNVGVGRFW